MVDIGQVHGTVNETGFRGTVPPAMSRKDSPAPVELKRPRPKAAEWPPVSGTTA